MSVERQLRDLPADLVNEDEWRRQLIDRLADIQVALWAREIDTDAEQAGAELLAQVGPGSAQILPQFDQYSTASPRAATYGLQPSDDSTTPGMGPDTYATWDRIAEKRQLLDLARTIASDGASTRRSIAALALLSLATIGLLGLAGASQFSASTLADMAESLPLISPSRRVVDRPDSLPQGRPDTAGAARFASHQVMGPPTPPPLTISRVAGDGTLDIVVGSPPARSQGDQIKRFRDAMPGAIAIATKLEMEVMAGGEAALPFALDMPTAKPELAEAVVLMVGLPSGVLPIYGSSPMPGLWSFKIADLDQQRLIFPGTVRDNFALRLAIMQPDGAIGSELLAQIKIKRVNSEQSLTGRQTVQVTRDDSNEDEAQASLNGRDLKVIARQHEYARRKAAGTVKPTPDPEPPTTLGAGRNGNTRPPPAATRSKSVDPTEPKSKTSEAPKPKMIEARSAKSNATAQVQQPDWSPFQNQTP